MNQSGDIYVREIAELLLQGECESARCYIRDNYPHCPPVKKDFRNYTEKQKMEQFVRDGFIDRYSGKRLLSPGILRVISYYYPKEFPYHKNWEMGNAHRAYWELIPTIDHIVPIAIGGKDEQENWTTTSMMNNSIKSNFTLVQLRWELVPSGDYNEWDGLTSMFIALVEKDKELQQNAYIMRWYRISKKICEIKCEVEQFSS